MGFFSSIKNKFTSDAHFKIGMSYAVDGKWEWAVEELTKAASNGHVNAQFNLGALFFHDLVDYEQAAYWLKLAADQGNSDAQFLLGVMMYDGKGFERSTKTILQACEYLQKSAQQGNQDALKVLKQIL